MSVSLIRASARIILITLAFMFITPLFGLKTGAGIVSAFSFAVGFEVFFYLVGTLIGKTAKHLNSEGTAYRLAYPLFLVVTGAALFVLGATCPVFVTGGFFGVGLSATVMTVISAVVMRDWT